MPTEVTATIMIGPIADESHHGRPDGAGGRLFCPRHVLTLMEGTRAAWILQCFPALRRPCPPRRILPSSPAHLLASAVLAYTAFAVPEVITASARLRDAVVHVPVPERRSRITRVMRLDDELAATVFAECGEHVYGLITVLPGSSITDDQLHPAADAGWLVARPGSVCL